MRLAHATSPTEMSMVKLQSHLDQSRISVNAQLLNDLSPNVKTFPSFFAGLMLPVNLLHWSVVKNYYHERDPVLTNLYL